VWKREPKKKREERASAASIKRKKKGGGRTRLSEKKLDTRPEKKERLREGNQTLMLCKQRGAEDCGNRKYVKEMRGRGSLLMILNFFRGKRIQRLWLAYKRIQGKLEKLKRGPFSRSRSF